MKATKYIWKNGEFVPWEEATTHVLTHALHYGTSVFEGVRAYETKKGSAIFRAQEHYERMVDSAKIYQMNIPYTADEMIAATKELIIKNGLRACYIRPIYYYGYGEMGLNPGLNPVDAMIAAWEWGTYLGEEGLAQGVKCKMSSWIRIDSRCMPPLAKCASNYINSVLAKKEALDCGFDEGILLNSNGLVAEGPGENIFVIKKGNIYTPPTSDGVLEGITCQTACKIAEYLGYSVQHKSLTRDELFLADELFFTGTAAEITPIREVDGRIIGTGKRGEITKKIQDKFFEIVRGECKDHSYWLDYVNKTSD
ncbi:MAG: branched-chain amino acid transaminase [bacterium]|nr:branched-chain amino acid transaminase [bacterium]